jgi:hypothetical protein
VRRNETPSSKGSGSGRGSRLHLTVLLATVAAFLLVPVAQAAALGTMKVNIAGTGSGEVFSYQESSLSFSGEPPIECSYASPGPATGVCEDEMEGEPEEQGVHIYAAPAPGSEFVGYTFQEGEDLYGLCGERKAQENSYLQWGGFICFAGRFSPGNAEVTATFDAVEKPTLLTIAKTGEGTVVSRPLGIECGSTCSHGFKEGKTVTLTASPATGYALSTWAGCTTHVGLTCTVEMSKAKTVKAGFVATPSLTVEKTGSGAGKVSATGISCDENCSKASSAIKAGTSVTVKVASAKGSEAAVFEGGTGSASGCSGATCTFTISENSSVKVRLDAISTKTLTVELGGPGAYKGKVTGKGTVKGLLGSAINCGSGCTSQTESFFSTDKVTLTAVAGTGYAFGGWSLKEGTEFGTCVGKNTPCTIATSSSSVLSAKFE